MLHQGIDKRSISLVLAVFQPLVEAADILTAKALDDDDHHILLALYERIRRGMDRRIDGIELLLRIVIRHLLRRKVRTPPDKEDERHNKSTISLADKDGKPQLATCPLACDKETTSLLSG